MANAYVSQSEMSRFERALDLKGFEGGKQFLREYFASPQMRFWDERRVLRVERIEQIRPGAAEEFEAFLAEYVQRNNVRWRNREQELTALLREEKEKAPLVYHNPFLNDKDFQKFLQRYAAALGVSKIDGTVEEDELRVKVAQEAYEKLITQREEYLRFIKDTLKDVRSLSDDDIEVIYSQLEYDVAKNPSQVDRVLKSYKEKLEYIRNRVQRTRREEESKFFDEHRDLLARKIFLLKLVIKSQKGFFGGVLVGSKKEQAIAELRDSFLVKFSNEKGQRVWIEDERGRVRSVEIELSDAESLDHDIRKKDEALAELEKLCAKPVG